MAVSKRVYIDPGHRGGDPGAVKYVVEAKVALSVANYMSDYLKNNYTGVITKISKGTDSTHQRSAEANKWKADIVVSIHFNAGGGDGFEVWVYSQANVPLGNKFVKQVIKVGQNSRGVKIDPTLNMLRLTKANAVLCEVAFVDNKKDIKDWDEAHELKTMGKALALAVVDELDLKPKKKPSGTQNKPQNGLDKPSGGASKESKVKVTAQSLRIRKGPGMEFDTVGYITDHGVYTIVETRSGWGHLKSGKGWISLKFTEKM